MFRFKQHVCSFWCAAKLFCYSRILWSFLLVLSVSLMKIFNTKSHKNVPSNKTLDAEPHGSTKTTALQLFYFYLCSYLFLFHRYAAWYTRNFNFPPENESKDEKFGVNDLNSHQIFNSLMVETKTRKVNFTLAEGERRKPTEKRDSPKNLVESEAQRIH